MGSVWQPNYVYIMTNGTRRRYIGITNDLHRRVYEHQQERLVYCEDSDDVGAAIGGEKEFKGWRRSKKIALIQTSIRNGQT